MQHFVGRDTCFSDFSFKYVAFYLPRLLIRPTGRRKVHRYGSIRFPEYPFVGPLWGLATCSSEPMHRVIFEIRLLYTSVLITNASLSPARRTICHCHAHFHAPSKWRMHFATNFGQLECLFPPGFLGICTLTWKNCCRIGTRVRLSETFFNFSREEIRSFGRGKHYVAEVDVTLKNVTFLTPFGCKYRTNDRAPSNFTEYSPDHYTATDETAYARMQLTKARAMQTS